MKPKEIGRLGETLAADFLIAEGYEVIARNLILKVGEIDLLCRIRDEIAVVEVKTLSDARYYDPAFRVDYRKVRKLRRLAEIIEQRFPDSPVTIEVVSIGWVDGQISIRHIKNILDC